MFEVNTAKKGRNLETEDRIRETVLRWAYNHYYDASGMTGQAFKISDAKKGLKNEGLTAKEASRGVEFLSQRGFLLVQHRPFQTRQGSTMPGTTYYKISDIGIEQIEGPSRFKQPEALAGINIENLGDVTIMGDGNIVHATFAAVYGPLDKIEMEIRGSKELTDSEKREIVAELRTMKGQLGKSHPDPGITSSSWRRLKSVAERIGSTASLILIAEKILISLGLL